MVDEREAAPAAREAIAANNARFAAALRRHDAVAMANCYSAGARLLPPGFPAIAGRDGICAFWSTGIMRGLERVMLETQSLDIRADLAVEVGRATVVMEPDDAPATTQVGKYVLLHERDGDTWRWALDVFNWDGPDHA